MSKSLSLTEQLAKHLQRKVDDATRDRARLHLLDWLGCVAGAREHLICSVSKFAERDGVARAALLGNVLEMDDVHRTAILHPGPVVWPAALGTWAIGGMDAVLPAAVRGYEAMIATGSTFDANHYAFYHPTATAGMFGGAVACSETLDHGDLSEALALAGSISGGLWQTRHSDNFGKQWHVAHAVHSGRIIADYASAGITGPYYVLEGKQGLYAATCKSPKPMEFPKRWRIWEVSFKPWGACRHAHPAIDAALELQALLGKLDGEILVETYADAIAFCDNPDPKNAQQAKFSLQHAIAIVATSGIPSLADFEPAAIKRMAKARARVTVRECKDITTRYPQRYGARVTFNKQVVEMIDTLGDPERPMSETQIVDKARALMAWGGLSDKQARKAVKLALEGDNADAIRKMLGKWLA
jgi:2-methylcitrate dehydratase PrpD